MTDQVLMPGADYQAICNAVRALTGGTEALKSGDIAGALAGVTPYSVEEGTIVLTEDGSITIPCSPQPTEVRVWATDAAALEDFNITSAVYVNVSRSGIFWRNNKVLFYRDGDSSVSTVSGSQAFGQNDPVKFNASQTVFFRAGIQYNWKAYYLEV